MTNSKTCFVGILIAMCWVCQARAEWTPLNISSNLSINVFAGHGGVLFAGTDNGIYCTANNGATWESYNTGLSWGTGVVPTVLSILISNDTLIAGTDGHGAYRSVNGGNTWTTADSGLNCKTVYAFTRQGSLVIAGTDKGIFVSSDLGFSWKPSYTGFQGPLAITALAVHGTAILAGSNAGVFVSIDNAVTWSPANAGFITDTNVVALVSVTDELFAATARGSVYVSRNNGATWTNVSNGLTIDSIRQNVIALAASDYEVYISNSKGIFHSTNPGVTWLAANTGIPKISGNFKGYAALYVDPINAQVFAGAFGDNAVMRSSSSFGVYRSAIGGASWEAVNAGLSHNYLYLYPGAIGGTNVFVGASTPAGFVGQSVLWHSADQGMNFAGSDIDEIDARGMFVTHDTLCAGVTTSYSSYTIFNSGVRLSLDSGRTWTNHTDATNRKTFSIYFDSKSGITALALFGGKMLANVEADAFGVYQSTDVGVTWQNASTGLPGAQNNHPTPAAFNHVGDVVIAATPNGVYALNGAETAWMPDTNGMGMRNVTMLLVDSGDVFATTSPVSSSDGAANVYVKRKGVPVWLPISNGIPSGTSCRDVTLSGTFMFLATDRGVYRSANRGDVWTSVVDSMRDPDIRYLAATDAYLFVSSATGIYRRPLPELTAVANPSDERQVPKKAVLSQNFPDPFNASTSIEYRLPAAGHVSLKVYNALGEIVDILVNDIQDAGTHRVLFTPRRLQSGVFWYTLALADKILTRKLSIVH